MCNVHIFSSTCFTHALSKVTLNHSLAFSLDHNSSQPTIRAFIYFLILCASLCSIRNRKDIKLCMYVDKMHTRKSSKSTSENVSREKSEKEEKSGILCVIYRPWTGKTKEFCGGIISRYFIRLSGGSGGGGTWNVETFFSTLFLRKCTSKRHWH